MSDTTPLLTPPQFDQLLAKAFDAHDRAAKTKTPEDRKEAETLREQARHEYERVFTVLNDGMTEALRP